MHRTGIEYLDLAWSPLVGCSGVGCAVRNVCWARAQMRRQLHRCKQCYDFTPHAHPERFSEPYKLRKKANIGVCFCADFYDFEFSKSTFLAGGEQVQSLLLAVMGNTKHNYLILTKQPQNQLARSSPVVMSQRIPFPKNVALGVSVNRKEDLWRMDALRKVDCSLRVASFEPLMEDLGELDLTGFGWVIIGGETRGGGTSFAPKRIWIEALIKEAGDIPIFIKKNLVPTPFEIQELRWEFPREW